MFHAQTIWFIEESFFTLHLCTNRLVTVKLCVYKSIISTWEGRGRPTYSHIISFNDFDYGVDLLKVYNFVPKNFHRQTFPSIKTLHRLVPWKAFVHHVHMFFIMIINIESNTEQHSTTACTKYTEFTTQTLLYIRWNSQKCLNKTSFCVKWEWELRATILSKSLTNQFSLDENRKKTQLKTLHHKHKTIQIKK